MSRGPVYGALTVSCAFRTLHACDDYLILEHFHTSTSSRQRWTCKAVTHCTAVCIRLSQGQWRSKALRDPDSTVTWGAFSCFGPKGWSWKPEVLRAGMGLWGGPATGPRERCKLPQWGPPAAKGFGTFRVLKWPLLLLETLCVLCKCVISYIFCIFCGPTRGPQELGAQIQWTVWTPRCLHHCTRHKMQYRRQSGSIQSILNTGKQMYAVTAVKTQTLTSNQFLNYTITHKNDDNHTVQQQIYFRLLCNISICITLWSPKIQRH